MRHRPDGSAVHAVGLGFRSGMVFAFLLVAATLSTGASAEGHLVTRFAVRVGDAGVVPNVEVAWRDQAWGDWTVTAFAGLGGGTTLGLEATRSVTFGPLGVVLLESVLAGRTDGTGAPSGSLAGSLTARGSLGPLAARVDLTRWTSHGTYGNDGAIGPLPALPSGSLLSMQVDARATQVWLMSGSWRMAWSTSDARHVGAVTVRQRRAWGSERDVGATFRVGRGDERTMVGVQVGVWHVPRRAPDRTLQVGVDVDTERGTLAAWVSSEGAWRAESGLLRWTARWQPHDVLRPGLDVALRFEPSDDTQTSVAPFLDLAWNPVARETPRGSVSLGVDVRAP